MINFRSSGGGTVYHDEGNINLCFLTSRAHYNRKANLNLVIDALTARWDLDLTVNDRDDIMLEKFYKVIYPSLSITCSGFQNIFIIAVLYLIVLLSVWCKLTKPFTLCS